jgi:hypothetical protein
MTRNDFVIEGQMLFSKLIPPFESPEPLFMVEAGDLLDGQGLGIPM